MLRIDPTDFLENEDELKKINVESVKALEETAYILVNEDGLKLPFLRESADPGIASKFLQNVTRI